MSRVFSIIVPVYNRPDELRELVYSLTQQTFTDFELVVVEDGSTLTALSVVDTYRDQLSIVYHVQENAGPAIARNTGMALAAGTWFLFIDSDCIAPEDWLEQIAVALEEREVDAFGGPDLAAPDFSLMQQAISFAMTSFFTTGGIRGGKRQIDQFHPRSFNMGIRREIFTDLGGFPVTRMHPGEDMVFTLEIIRRGYRTAFFPATGVYHKRRNTLKSFYRQVFRFGKTRFILSRVYSEAGKWIFALPSVLTVAALLLILLSLWWSWLFILPLITYSLLIFLSAAWPTQCAKLGLLAVITSAIQIIGYGWGYLRAFWDVKVLGRDEYGVFRDGFYSA